MDEPIDNHDDGDDEADYSVTQLEGLGKRSPVYNVHSEVRPFYTSSYCMITYYFVVRAWVDHRPP